MDDSLSFKGLVCVAISIRKSRFSPFRSARIGVDSGEGTPWAATSNASAAAPTRRIATRCSTTSSTGREPAPCTATAAICVTTLIPAVTCPNTE